MKFVGQGNDPIYLKVLDGITGTGATAGGALSVEGSAGQLFSIVNRLGTGSIFSVNDISGIPIIDANANGNISLAGYFGNVGVGLTAPTEKFQVLGNISASGLVTAVSGISAAGGVTLAGTLQGTTGSFSKLLTLSGGLSASGGITFSSPIVLPINTAPAITIGTHSTRNLILSCVDSVGLIEVGGNTTASLTVRQASGGPVLVGGPTNAYLALYEDDNNAYLQSTNLFIGDADGVANGNYIHIDDASTTITATCGSFGVSGRLDMNGGYSEAGATATQATNTITFNAVSGNTQKFVPSAVVNTVNFTNINTASTQCTSATLIFLHGATPYGLTTGTFSVQLAGVTKTVKWSGGSAPVLTNTANKTDILNFLTYDGGTTWLGFVGGLNF
jgi:hypothetical protein